MEHEIDIWIDLVQKFIPKQINIDNEKELAMYELFHRMKQFKDSLETVEPPIEKEKYNNLWNK